MKKLLVTVFVSLWIVFLLTAVSAEAAKQQPRGFYLTQDTFTGSQALTACADGYHMASLWEILDVSNLKYNTTLGLTTPDSGSGPPTSKTGWIRTGYTSGSSPNSGIGNCNAWTSDDASDAGTFVFLPFFWDDPPPPTAPWTAIADSCALPRPVWCVQD